MAEDDYYAPHETRMLALDLAVTVAVANRGKFGIIAPSRVIAQAREFEAYLTSKPTPGFEAEPDFEEPEPADPQALGPDCEAESDAA